MPDLQNQFLWGPLQSLTLFINIISSLIETQVWNDSSLVIWQVKTDWKKLIGNQIGTHLSKD